MAAAGPWPRDLAPVSPTWLGRRAWSQIRDGDVWIRWARGHTWPSLGSWLRGWALRWHTCSVGCGPRQSGRLGAASIRGGGRGAAWRRPLPVAQVGAVGGRNRLALGRQSDPEVQWLDLPSLRPMSVVERRRASSPWWCGGEERR
ncbi:hypothetical protein ZEAMMB73_Zm00001d041361 [Zea mays]|uniref:Uncharacterized protein n=1 Tax=Zea mays TaxID=4577 RepID=A0A1D6MVM3_MAIZE|nr:hypothetical protein ZEAMMB73_Zm00001d041361 [Zea mays]